MFFDDFIHQQKAHQFLSSDEAAAIRKTPRQAEKIVRSITDKKLKGSDQQFLEIIDLLLDQEQSILSLKLCTYALDFCAKKGNFFAAQIEALLEINGEIAVSSEMIGNFDIEFQQYPAYRLGKAICRLFLSLAEIFPEPQQEEYAEKGLSYADTLKKMEPKNEFGYYFEVRFLHFIDPYEAEKRLCMYVMLGKRIRLNRSWILPNGSTVPDAVIFTSKITCFLVEWRRHWIWLKMLLKKESSIPLGFYSRNFPQKKNGN